MGAARALLASALAWRAWLCAALMLTFPKGFFDMTRMKTREALYLNMIAQSAIEYGGTTIEELDALSRIREVEPRNVTRPAAAKPSTPSRPTAPLDTTMQTAFHLETTSLSALPEELATTTPKSPFRRLHDPGAVADEVDNPFEEIATRGPAGASAGGDSFRRNSHKSSSSTTSRGFSEPSFETERTSHPPSGSESVILQRSQLLGVYRPHRVPSAAFGPREDLSESTQSVPSRLRNRKFFTDVDITNPTVIALPIPPPL